MRCLINRILISHALDRNRLPGRSVQKHVDCCDDCKRFYSASVALSEGLRTARAAADESWDPSLTERIVASAAGRRRAPTRKVRPRRAHRKPAPWMVAAAAGLLIVITSALILFDDLGGGDPTRDEIAASLEAVTDLGQKLLGRHLTVESDDEFLGLVAEPLGFAAQPLVAEVDRLADDAEAMRGFVVAILPINLLHAASNPDRQD